MRRTLITLAWVAAALSASATDNCSNLPSPANVAQNGLGRVPMMGWSAWYPYGTSATASNYAAQGSALVSTGLAAAGYTWVEITDGWPAGSRVSGNLVADATKFPSGMAPTISTLHADGLQVMMYSSPYTSTCAGFLGSGLSESADATTFAGWGADGLKYDGCTVASLYPSCYESRAPQIWQYMAQAIVATGRPMYLTIGVPVALWQDTWSWGNQAGYNDNRVLNQSDVNGNWSVFASQADLFASVYTFSKPGFTNNCDYMQGPAAGWSFAASQAQFGMCALWASPLILGMDLTTISPTYISLYSNPDVIAVDQDVSVKGAYRFASSVCGSSTCETWVKPLSDGSWAIGLFNRDLASHTLSVSMANFGGNPAVRDLWANSNLGNMSSYSATVLSDGLALIKVTAAGSGTTLQRLRAQKAVVR